MSNKDSKNTHSPKLRFKGFENEWDLIKMIDFAPLQRGFDLPVINIQEGVYPVVFSNGILKTHNEFKVKAPGVVTGRSGTIGKVTYVEYDYWPHNTALWVTNFNSNDPKFVYYFYSNFKLESLGTGSGVPTLNRNDVHAQKRCIPSLPEQQKIAAFLSAVDEKIQLLTRKKELLTQYKKGVMQQLFSGKLRFKDEQGKDFSEWEEKRLDEVISKFIVPMRDKPKSLSGPIPWCRIEDFDGKYLSKSKSNQGVDIETIKEMNLKVYPIGTLLVSCSANLGFCAITKAELITNQTFIGLVPDLNKIDVLFLFYVMKRSSVKLNTLSSGTTISYLSREQFEKFKIPYPNLLEQRKLSEFISKIDDQIDMISSQITQTQTFKKGLLQQMFV